MCTGIFLLEVLRVKVKDQNIYSRNKSYLISVSRKEIQYQEILKLVHYYEKNNSPILWRGKLVANGIEFLAVITQ